jgi:hypothetical protein
VREDVAGDLVGGEVPLLGQREHRQQLGDVGADHVRADDLVVLASATTLTKPDGLAEPMALPLAEKGTSRS